LKQFLVVIVLFIIGVVDLFTLLVHLSGTGILLCPDQLFLLLLQPRLLILLLDDGLQRCDVPVLQGDSDGVGSLSNQARWQIDGDF